MFWTVLRIRACLFFLPEDISSLHEPNVGPNSFLVECDCVPRSIGTASLFQLVFHSPPDETKLGTAVRAFGSAMDSFFLGIEVLATVQILFLANVLWSAFKGERTSGPTNFEPFPATKKAST
jgi:hypothetical protein